MSSPKRQLNLSFSFNADTIPEKHLLRDNPQLQPAARYWRRKLPCQPSCLGIRLAYRGLSLYDSATGRTLRASMDKPSINLVEVASLNCGPAFGNVNHARAMQNSTAVPNFNLSTAASEHWPRYPSTNFAAQRSTNSMATRTASWILLLAPHHETRTAGFAAPSASTPSREIRHAIRWPNLSELYPSPAS